MNWRFIATAAALAVAGGDAGAAPLDAATCGLLRSEQAQLEQSGVRDSMAKGPEWAKAKLTSEKLDQIRRLMFLDEQMLFRCSGRNLIELPPEADADPAPAEGNDKDANKDKAPSKKAGAPEKAKPAKAAPKKEATGKAQEPQPAKKAGASAPKPKAKVDDAYRPPAPADPQGDPFAKQLKQ